MNRSGIYGLVFVFFVLGIFNTTEGARERIREADPAKAEAKYPDFKVQGEYTGEILCEGKMQKVGVQVVARGNGNFDVVGYAGGLPGAGWDKTDPVRTKGKTDNGVTTFSHEDFIGKIKDGTLNVTSKEGKSLGRLTRIIRKSPTLGAKPPPGAVVLFDGTTADKFKGGRMTEDGLLMEGVESKQHFQSGTLHMEFRTPFMPHDGGQNRGNSGVYLQGRYEVQILDSFGDVAHDHDCGGIYSVGPPALNMCFPPLTWQTYDVEFTKAEKDEKGKLAATMTVRHNGVLVHKDVKIDHFTIAAIVRNMDPAPGPIYLQNHGSPVRFRNIWLVEKE